MKYCEATLIVHSLVVNIISLTYLQIKEVPRGHCKVHYTVIHHTKYITLHIITLLRVSDPQSWRRMLMNNLSHLKGQQSTLAQERFHVHDCESCEQSDSEMHVYVDKHSKQIYFFHSKVSSSE